MADQEVIKHTKKIYKIWNSEAHGFWYKAKEFVLEILIIVFAVSLSIWLHGRSEHTHQQKDVKDFLLGLEADLKSDLQEMKEDRATYQRSGMAFKYLRSLKRNETANADSIYMYANVLFNTTGLLPNNSRYEGFKSSGKIGTIENKELQNEIVDLYQDNIPILISFTNYYNEGKRSLNSYFNKNLKRLSDSTTNFNAVMATDEAYNIAGDLNNVKNIIKQYDKCINNVDRIKKLIDKEYNQ